MKKKLATAAAALVIREKKRRAAEVDRLNHRPRKVWGYCSLHEVFFATTVSCAKPLLAVALQHCIRQGCSTAVLRCDKIEGVGRGEHGDARQGIVRFPFRFWIILCP